MRQSVEKQKQATKAQKAVAKNRHKRAALWLVALFFASVMGLFLSFSNWFATQQIKASSTAIAEAQAQSKQYQAQAKVNAAKKAEAAAQAQMAAEMQAKAETERAIAAAKQTNPSTSTTASCGVSDPAAITVVINKKHCFSPLSWAPGDLTSVNGYLMRSAAASQMTTMMADATAAGAGFDLTSTYRSYDNQVTTYNHWVQVNGSAASADTVSARPGYSEHQTGLAADLQTPGCALECFGDTGAYTWLTAHAADYGFINRYPAGLSDITGYAPEPWHWRYVGVNVAKDMKAKGIQTLEQYYGISGGSY